MNLFKTLQIAIPCTMGATIVVVPSIVAATDNSKVYDEALCFECAAGSSSTVQYEAVSSDKMKIDIEYKINGGEWQDWELIDQESGHGLSIPLTIKRRQKVYIRNTTEYLSNSKDEYVQFKIDGNNKIKASGNINSLVNYQDDLSDFSFYELFYDCDGLTKAPDITTHVGNKSCYYKMFALCDSLKDAPKIKAEKLCAYACESMFNSCTHLTNAPLIDVPNLGGTAVFKSCFAECHALINVPKTLPATTLTSHCYDSMFMNCSLLTKAPLLPAGSLHMQCYQQMFKGCSKLKILADKGKNVICDFRERHIEFPTNATRDMFADTAYGTIEVLPEHFYSYE
ncbi:MAG: hypothetical protein KBS35_02570 [Mycoplasma sp.]|nr:hypothetical protein [Candidatus Hennigella equi]